MILTKPIPFILPLAIKWAEYHERKILEKGVFLWDLRDARKMGVAHPELIRLLRVDKIPYARKDIGAMTFRYGIYIREDLFQNRVIIAHECVHVAQYERLGMEGFLRQYLTECLSVGYESSPLELEAIQKSDVYTDYTP